MKHLEHVQRLRLLLTVSGLLLLLPAAGSSSGVVLEEFKMPPCLDLMTVPVSLRGETYEFLLDTGASGCLFDGSLAPLLGEPVGRAYAQTPAGVEAVPLYRTPEASVGDLALDPDDLVACFDLSELVQLTGMQINGIIGMSFIERFGLELDFDAGFVRFLDSPVVPDSMIGAEVELDLQPDSPPGYTATLLDTVKWSFIFDTGCTSPGSIDHEAFSRLDDIGLLHSVGFARRRALHKSYTANLFVLDSLAIGQFDHRDLFLTQSESSVLGLPVLAQYNATFDFPERRLWLRASDRHRALAPSDISGLGVMKLAGEPVVAALDPQGPAAALGLEQGDVLVSVGGALVTDLSVACISDVFAQAMGDTIELVVSRFGDQFTEILDLRWTKRSRDRGETKTRTKQPPD